LKASPSSWVRAGIEAGFQDVPFPALEMAKIDIQFLDDIIGEIREGVEGDIDQHLEIGTQEGAKGLLIGLIQQVARALFPIVDEGKGQVTTTVRTMKGRHLEHTFEGPAAR
jgi:hypothetical protein